MKQDKPWLRRANKLTKVVGERFVQLVMDPKALEDLNARVMERTRLTDRSKRMFAFAMKIGFFPYALLRLAVNLGLLFTVKKAPSMGPLIKATDFFPSPKVRKLLKKMVAEQGIHIATLAGDGRFKTARWIWFSSWLLLIWYGCRGLIMTVAKAIQGRAA